VKAAQHANFVWSSALICVLAFASDSSISYAQKDKDKSTPPPLLTRVNLRHENRRFAYGGTLTLVGAPSGSIQIYGWDRDEVDVSADIELHATNEDDLTTLARVNNFIIDEDTNHIRILTTGTHDRKLIRLLGRNLPKNLVAMPWKIDYRIRVPTSTDLEISQGVGPIKLWGVEGAVHLNAVMSDAVVSLTGGDSSITLERGSIYFGVPTRGWHGLGADVKLASGNLIIEFPANFSADINASVLRQGRVEVAYPNLEPRERNSITPQSVRVRAGNGGATLSFMVGDGTIIIGRLK